MRLAVELAGSVAKRLTLEVDPNTVRVEGFSPEALDLVPGGDALPTVAGGQRVDVEAKWDGPHLILKRSTEQLEIVDRYEPVGGDRLLITRTVKMPFGSERKVAWTYRREEG